MSLSFLYGRPDTYQNLLDNTEIKIWSNLDTNKGIATMTFDAGDSGGGDIPDPGDTATGDTSGATGKVISITVSSGSFAGGNAAGTISLGACAGRFHDNETVTFTDGETVVVNHPNSAAGVDLIQNGEFSVDTDPPPGWTAGNSATLTTEAGGKVGNCLMITENGEANPYAFQARTVTAGKIYYLTVYVKAGTEASYTVSIWDVSNNSSIYTTGSLEETAGDWSTVVAQYFVVPSGCSSIRVRVHQVCAISTGTTIYFDEVSLYEVTPCCTGADTLAFDGWTKTTGLDIYREHPGSNTKNGSPYSLFAVNGSGSTQYLIWQGNRTTKTDFLRRFYGRNLCGGIWAKASAASKVRIVKYEDAYGNVSDLNSGTDFEWLEGTFTCGASAADVRPFVISIADGATVYLSQPMFIFGTYIGEGNYVPKPNETIYFEKYISSQKFHNKTGADGFSDVSNTTLILEADSIGCIGKGIKSVYVCVVANDSGSAGTDCYFRASSNLSSVFYEFYCSPYGYANDTKARIVGQINCNEDGNFQYKIEATGSSTFDIPHFTYIGAKLR